MGQLNVAAVKLGRSNVQWFEFKVKGGVKTLGLRESRPCEDGFNC